MKSRVNAGRVTGAIKGMEEYYNKLRSKMTPEEFSKRVKFDTVLGWSISTIIFLSMAIFFSFGITGNPTQAPEFRGAVILFGFLGLASLGIAALYFFRMK